MNCTILLVALALSPGQTDCIFGRPVLVNSRGDKCLAGQLVMELSPALRGRVRLGVENGTAVFGIPELDRLNRRYGAARIEPLMRNPRPDAMAMKHGCDLQYLVEFPEDVDAQAALKDYAALASVKDVSPNLLMETVDDVPDDSLYPLQWHLDKIGAPFAWGIAHGDTSALIAVFDDGCEWHHPDIQSNLWINRAEDVNHNGRFDTLPWPDGDIDGLDQDTNGYADDVIGFDMLLGQPDPRPYLLSDEHGTHCWGIANAVTNNHIGVSGAAWNCRSFAFRCGGGGLISLAAAIAGIYYAAPKGCWVVSMSFGSYSYNQTMADACDYAWDSGLVLVGGAGNDGTNRRFYPADYDHVISVAASDRLDAKPSWSNYGDWIEVVSPGVGIYSTITDHRYATMDGTSMATPLVAGVLAWVKSEFPSFTNVQACSTLYAGCVPMHDTLYTQGLLGHGRISMSRIVMPLYRSDLHLTDWRFRDENGNGRPDPGEYASLIVTYLNTEGWRDATGVSATLISSNPNVEVLKATATFPDIPAGSSGSCSNDSFVIRVADGTPPQMITFRLTVQATPEVAFPETSFAAQSGEPRVLIVDDDNGSDFEKFYTAACDSNGVLYHTYSVLASGSPSADTLKHYPVVFWFTGNDTASTLTDPDIDALTDFLNTGHNLFLSSQNVAQDLNGNPFLADYLHAQLLDDSTGKPYLVGMEGDPITQEDTVVLAGAGGANNGKSLDGIRALAGASGCAFYKDYGNETTYAAIRYSGTYRLVYFSVPFEAVDHSVSRYLQKWTLVKRILEYFGERVPGVELERQPTLAGQRLDLQVTPNPSRTGLAAVRLSSALPRPLSLTVSDVSGRVVLRSTFVTGTSSFALDLRSMSAGVYLLDVDSQGTHATTKLILAR
jgi:subtilisin family serine protease